MQMFQRYGFGVAVIGAAMISAVAGAQETKPIGLSVKAGMFMPSQADARAQGGQWFSGGLEFKLRDLGFGIGDPSASTSLTASVDFITKGPFQHVPVMVNYVGRRNEVYWSVGAGIGMVKTEEVRLVGPPQVLESKSSTGLAYQVGVGYDFQHGRSPVFIEARYIGSSKSTLNGLGVFLGIRL